MTTVTGAGSVQTGVVPAPIRRVREVPVFRNRFGTLYNDDVVAPSGATGQYLRWQARKEGAVVVPVGPAGYAFVSHYRYPIQAASLEFPRGSSEDEEGLAAAAVRELREETGLVCASLRPLGTIHADTGILAAPIRVYAAEVDVATAESAEPEAMESLTEPVWVTPEDLPGWLAEGRITCGITLAALALLQAHHQAGRS
ncbi:NUDIX hydrolase [Streptomyces drozdowiczii]|uniref:NUDIX hydrolase n=1 Tax=Streptomyces drozdowiczii TaxID=202862 RepID=A0ABY6PL06_9ACTN|nr:NUDIX hydrolase [Streptomyces drozdowiczii]MCX0247723.1 NUDIX hydrolase [Streptomyces drozdowiczii]UZK52908.1 NUDIX hydrolase [Streptomyces drozdowiczii]